MLEFFCFGLFVTLRVNIVCHIEIAWTCTQHIVIHLMRSSDVVNYSIQERELTHCRKLSKTSFE